MKNPGNGKRPGRPTSRRVSEDCAAIARLLSAGEDEAGIRAQLGLTRRALAHRLRRLRRAALDPHLVWVRYSAASRLDLARLDEIVEAALKAQPPRYGLVVRVTAARARLRRETIQIGCLLGVYSSIATTYSDGPARAERFRDLFPVSDATCTRATG